jgi:hypothetical protein
MTNLQNSQDLAPNFAGTLYGIINFVGTTSGFISPLIVAYFTQERVSLLDVIFECLHMQHAACCCERLKNQGN